MTQTTAAVPDVAVAPAGYLPTTRRLLVAAAGLLLLQLAWVVAIPAFGGMDEFDHSYRASAVAHGQWVAPAEAATRGTGAWVFTDPSLPRAAQPECEELKYTSDDDCVGSAHGDLTRIASGAGRYNPVFYAMVGYPSLPFHGTTELLVMRVLTALFSTGLVLLGLLVTRRWARTRWPYVGALVVLTPTVLYSTGMAAPNGVEMAAGFAFWSALIGLLAGDPRRADRLTVAVATLGGVLLVSVRSLGPLWCLLAAVVVVVASTDGFTRIRSLLRDRAVLGATAVMAVATAASVLWTRAQGSLVIGKEAIDPMPVGQKIGETWDQVPLWLFQSIAAFPYRNDHAPVVVYACSIVLGIGLVALGWRGGDRRLRLGLVLSIVLAAVVPAVIVYSTMETYYYAWQGRYALPFTLGLLLLAGLGAERRRGAERGPGWQLLAPAVVLFAVSELVSVLWVLDFERRTSPSVSNGDWAVPPVWLVVAMTVAGTLLLWNLVRPDARTRPEHVPETEPVIEPAR